MPDVAQLEGRIKWLETVIANRFPKTVAAHRTWIVETVQNIVCDQMETQREWLLSDRRFEQLVWARHVAMTLSYELSGLSTSRLALLFNRLDHSTVLHAIQQVRTAERHYQAKRQEVQAIRQRVQEAISCSLGSPS